MSINLDTFLLDDDLVLKSNKITYQYDFITIRFCNRQTQMTQKVIGWLRQTNLRKYPIIDVKKIYNVYRLDRLTETIEERNRYCKDEEKLKNIYFYEYKK